MKRDTVVISVGGSLIAPPDGLDTAFLGRFKRLIEREVRLGHRFIIITGGGATARSYQAAGKKVSALAAEDLDWLGIHSTRLNGHLLRSIFRKLAYPALVKNPAKKVATDRPVIIAAGWKPGFSTDFVATKFAQTVGAKKLINLSNIDHLYTKDPKKFKSAKAITEISWTEFRKMIPKKWDPGIHTPFDPIAAALAEKSGMEVAIMGGNLAELSNYLSGKRFTGTKIS